MQFDPSYAAMIFYNCVSDVYAFIGSVLWPMHYYFQNAQSTGCIDIGEPMLSF